MTPNQKKTVREITERWHNGGAGRTTEQATFDIGFLTGVIFDLAQQLQAREKTMYVSPPYLHTLTELLAWPPYPRGVNVVRFERFADFINDLKFRLKAADRVGALDALVSQEIRMMDLPEEDVFDVSKP